MTNPTKNKVPTKPVDEPIEVEKKAQTPPQAVIKIVNIPMDEDYTEPNGWIIKDIYNSEVNGSEKFYAILVKVQDRPTAGIRKSPVVNLKD